MFSSIQISKGFSHGYHATTKRETCLLGRCEQGRKQPSVLKRCPQNGTDTL